MSSASIETTRAQLRSLATELVTLADTYEPGPFHSIGLQSEFLTNAKQLVSTAQTSLEYGLGLILASMETAVIQTLYSINALQSIPIQGSISLEELAILTHADASLLQRLLRVLVGSGFIDQKEDADYAHTPRSAGFAKEAPPGEFFSFLYTAGIDVIIRLPEYLKVKHEQTITTAQPDGHYAEPGGVNGTTHNPSTWRYNQEGRTIFEIYATMPEASARFQKVMGSVARLNPFTGFYDFDRIACPSEPSRPVIVDVGGGHGPAISHMLAAHPAIHPSQCVLQDLAQVVGTAHNGNPDLPAEVVLQPNDYFSPQPVHGARAYHIRAIAHDLSDENLIRVLEQITPAMVHDSKVLIADNILPERGTKGMSGLNDMMMMLIAGKERTEAEFSQVLRQAGLKIDAIFKADGERTYAMIEASLL